MVIAVRILLWITYPLNFMVTDGPNIYCLYLAYLVAKQIFGGLSASLFVLIYGLHFQVLNVTLSITPEWLQGSLFMLLWYLLFRAYQIAGLAGKTWWYSMAGFAFCWMYLVKFNSIALLTLPAIVAVCDLRRSRKGWLPITAGALTANEAELDALLTDIEIPEPYDFSIAFLPVFHFIGYQEGNDLGVQVFIEHLRRYPVEYLLDAWNLTVRTLTKPKPHWMYPISFKGRPGRALEFGFVELKPRRKLAEEPTYRYPVPIVWGPGVRFFNLHFTGIQVPTIWIVIVIVGGAIAAARSAVRQRSNRRAATVYLALFLTIVLFILFSNFVYHFRWKEVHPIMPAVCLLVSVALLGLHRWVTGLDEYSSRTPAGPA